MSNELKPCPFCGGEAVCKKIQAGRSSWVYRVECSKQCEVFPFTHEHSTKRDAINSWNTRPDVEQGKDDKLTKRRDAIALVLHHLAPKDKDIQGFGKTCLEIMDAYAERVTELELILYGVENGSKEWQKEADRYREALEMVYQGYLAPPGTDFDWDAWAKIAEAAIEGTPAKDEQGIRVRGLENDFTALYELADEMADYLEGVRMDKRVAPQADRILANYSRFKAAIEEGGKV